VDNGIALPELIFIDINMPRMDGWEFIDEYKKIDLNLRNQSLVFLLTSSIDPSDLAKAKAIEEIKELRDKPIDEKLVLEIFDKYINVH
jgi:CheY-like chemotaxis protein